MATFSTNQTRQFYVVTEVATGDVTTTSETGTAKVYANPSDNEAYVVYKGVDSILRSDLINKDSVRSFKATAASKLQRGLKKLEVSVDPGLTPLPVGEVCILTFTILEWVGISPEDVYSKYGSVKITPGMTAGNLLKTLKSSLDMNFSKEEIEMFKFSLDNETNPSKLIIEEVEQPWSLGLKESNSIKFTLRGNPVQVQGIDVPWVVIEEIAPSTFVDNGKKVADMEYFYMGERGDQYRNMGFPNVVKTSYLVNPTLPYHTLDIAFYFEDQGTSAQKSEKVLTIVVPSEGADSATKIKVVNQMITSINSALGTNTPLLTAE